MVTQGEERAEGQPSAWAPLRSRVYRALFIAQLSSSIGTWMQTVAAQWFLVERHSSDVIVALVQTASLGPTLLLGLLAGVLADLFDRRRLLIFLQSYAVLAALALAVLTYLGRLGPTSLLIFTAAIGCASALTGPAWQAIQPEVVPREQIPAASTLGSVAGNAARAIGPALGGLVVALAGAAAVFAINAVSFVTVILLWWRGNGPSTARRSSESTSARPSSPDCYSFVTVPICAGSFCAQPFSCFRPRLCWLCCR